MREHLPAVGFGGVAGATALTVVYLISHNLFATPADVIAKIEQVRADIASSYVTKAEYSAAIDKVNDKLDRILYKLDTKQDKAVY